MVKKAKLKMPLMREKSHLESKKFVAWLISELTWKVLIVVVLVLHKEGLVNAGVGAGVWWFLMSIVITAGFIGIGFILGQAALDKYVRVAEIAANEIRERLPGGNKPPDATQAELPVAVQDHTDPSYDYEIEPEPTDPQVKA